MPTLSMEFKRRIADDDPSHALLWWAVTGDGAAVTFCAIERPARLRLHLATLAPGWTVVNGDREYATNTLTRHRTAEGGAIDCPWVDSCCPEAYLTTSEKAVLAEWESCAFTDAAMWQILRRIYERDLAVEAVAA